MKSLKRCPNGSRKIPLTGKCVKKEEIAVKHFCEIAKELKQKIKEVEKLKLMKKKVNTK